MFVGYIYQSENCEFHCISGFSTCNNTLGNCEMLAVDKNKTKQAKMKKKTTTSKLRRVNKETEVKVITTWSGHSVVNRDEGVLQTRINCEIFVF